MKFIVTFQKKDSSDTSSSTLLMTPVTENNADERVTFNNIAEVLDFLSSSKVGNKSQTKISVCDDAGRLVSTGKWDDDDGVWVLKPVSPENVSFFTVLEDTPENKKNLLTLAISTKRWNTMPTAKKRDMIVAYNSADEPIAYATYNAELFCWIFQYNLPVNKEVRNVPAQDQAVTFDRVKFQKIETLIETLKAAKPSFVNRIRQAIPRNNKNGTELILLGADEKNEKWTEENQARLKALIAIDTKLKAVNKSVDHFNAAFSAAINKEKENKDNKAKVNNGDELKAKVQQGLNILESIKIPENNDPKKDFFYQNASDQPQKIDKDWVKNKIEYIQTLQDEIEILTPKSSVWATAGKIAIIILATIALALLGFLLYGIVAFLVSGFNPFIAVPAGFYGAVSAVMSAASAGTVAVAIEALGGCGPLATSALSATFGGGGLTYYLFFKQDSLEANASRVLGNVKKLLGSIAELDPTKPMEDSNSNGLVYIPLQPLKYT